MFTVCQIAENTYIFRRDGSDRGLIVDPGDEADKLLAAIDALGIQLDGILLTHTHFDHVGAVFSGDVLFQGSIGRTDLPGGDFDALMESIRSLLDTLPGETTVYPGHMGITTLAAERATNPFLAELAR